MNTFVKRIVDFLLFLWTAKTAHERAISRWIDLEMNEMAAHEKAMNRLTRSMAREFRKHNGSAARYHGVRIEVQS